MLHIMISFDGYLASCSVVSCQKRCSGISSIMPHSLPSIWADALAKWSQEPSMTQMLSDRICQPLPAHSHLHPPYLLPPPALPSSPLRGVLCPFPPIWTLPLAPESSGDINTTTLWAEPLPKSMTIILNRNSLGAWNIDQMKTKISK